MGLNMASLSLGPIDAFNHVWREEADKHTDFSIAKSVITDFFHLIVRLVKSLRAGFIGLIGGYAVTQVEAQEYLLRNEKSEYPNRSICTYSVRELEKEENTLILTTGTRHYTVKLLPPIFILPENYDSHLKIVMSAFSPEMQCCISIEKQEKLLDSHEGEAAAFEAVYTINLNMHPFAVHSSGLQENSFSNKEDGRKQANRKALAGTVASLCELQKFISFVPIQDQHRITFNLLSSGLCKVMFDEKIVTIQHPAKAYCCNFEPL